MRRALLGVLIVLSFIASPQAQWFGRGQQVMVTPGSPVSPGTCDPMTVSVSGTREPTPDSTITDDTCDIWTLGTGTTPNIVIKRNGSATGTLGAQILWYVGVLYIQGSDLNWYKWQGAGFVFYGVSDPETNMPPPAPTYYVSTTGSDIYTCTQALSISTPKRSISAGVACLSPGDILLIRGGTYTGTANTIDSTLAIVPSGTSMAPITISAYPGGLTSTLTPGPRGGAEVVTIRPPSNQQAIRLTTNSPSYLVFEDLVIDMVNQTVGDQSGGPNGIYLSTLSNNNTFLHLEVKNGAATAISTSQNGGQADNEQILYCSIHDNGLDSTYANSGYGIYGNTSGNVIDGNDIYNNHGYGIQFNSWPSNNIIRNNLVHNNVPWNVAGGLGGTTGGGITVQGDTDDSRGSPLGHVNDNQIYNNVVFDNGQGGGGATTGDGIRVYTWSRGTLVYNNTVYHQKGDGIALQFYDSTTPPIIRNNIVYLNGGTAIIDYGDLNSMTGSPTIDHNLLTNPSFVNAGIADFHLQMGSAAKAAGVFIALVVVDKDGTTRANPPSDGAYE